MRVFKKLFIIVFFVMLFTTTKACAEFYFSNDLTSLFKANKATIYELNVRTFGAKDLNGDGIIDESKGEERGSFINAIPKLDKLLMMGVNTIHLLPITPVGTTKALGTAGSLYSASSFDEINPQLADKNSGLSVEDQAKEFIKECHNRKIRVIVDLPACGSYDLYLKHPELFIKDKNNNPIIPSDWTDVRLLNPGTQTSINQDVYNLYAGFVDMIFDIGADGIRADVASLKTPIFWQKLINETKSRDPQFLFLAESYALPQENPTEYATFTPYNKLLDAGFDGFYSNFSSIKDWKTAKDLYNCIDFNLALTKKYNGQKSVISSFTTHDETSPILIHGANFSIMMSWLSATLPFNQYFTDGFSTGDSYIYHWANRKAPNSFTDDDYYFVHRGKLDIFNFSRAPGGDNQTILNNLLFAQRFRTMSGDALQKGSYKQLKTSNPYVFAYQRIYNKSSIVVIGNLNFEVPYGNVRTYCIGINKQMNSFPIKATNLPIVETNKVISNLSPGEIQVIYFEKDSKKDAIKK